MIAEYNSFSISQQEAVHFYQPSSSSIALNRVVRVDPSSIFGTLTANGRIFLVNPNGVLFGPNSHVDAAALIAATLNISNTDFLAGIYNFNKVDGKTGVSIVNQGYIKAGSVSLIGQAVANSGVIEATLGSVVLAAGDAITLNLDSAGMISVVIAEPVKEAVEGASSAVENSGKISADGGKVILAAKTLNNVFDYVVNQTGVIEAKSLATKNGEIVLDGGNSGIVANSGTLDVSGKDTGETGGTVKVLGEYVGLFDNSVIDASGDARGGTVLIGGNFQGKGPEPNAYRTYVGQGAVINANAITNGDGGKVIIWSDDATWFYGNISARGGIEGGDGGFVEVSGYENLAFRGQVDLSASLGRAGTLLLDPANIQITGGITGGTADGSDNTDNKSDELKHSDGSNTKGKISFTDEGIGTPNPFLVYESELENTNADIILQARNEITTFGSFSGQQVLISNNRDLTLETRNSSGDGSAGINLTGSNDGANLEFRTQGNGTITIQTGTGSSPLATPITVGKLTTANQSITISSSGTLSVGTLNAGTSTVSLTAGGAITQTGTITANTLNLTNTSGTTTLNTQANTLTNLGIINASSQLFSIRNTATLGQSGVITAGTFAATLDAGALNLGTQSNAISNLGAITAPGGFTLTNGNNSLTATGAISTSNNAISVSTGTGTFTQTAGAGSTIASGSGAITITANSIALNTTANTITGSGAIILQPATAARPIVIGTAGAATDFALNTDEIASLTNGFSSITIGHASGTGTITINEITFNDPVTIRVPSGSGSIIVNGQITGSDNASITLDGSGATTTLNDNIVTNNQNINISDSVVIGQGKNILLSTGAGAGNIIIDGTTQGTAGSSPETLTLNAGTGTVTFGGYVHGFGGGWDSSGLTDLTITNSGIINFNGSIAITGALTQTNAATGATTFGSAVSVGSAALSGTSYNVNNSFAADIVSGSSGVINVTNSGLFAKGATGAITTKGGFSTTGDVSLANNITTTNSTLSIGGNLTLAADVVLSTQVTPGAGGISVTGTTNSSGGARDLTLAAGSGDITLTGAVGATSALDVLKVNSGATTTFGSTVRANDIDISSTTTRFTGNVTALTDDIDIAGNLVLLGDILVTTGQGNNDNFTVSGATNGDAAGRSLTVNAGSGDVILGGVVGGVAALQTLAINAANAIILPAVTTRDGGITVVTTGGGALITLNGNLSTDSIVTAGTVSLSGPVRLGANITIDTDAETTDANITVTGSINADSATNNRTLTLIAGKGNIDLQGNIGASVALQSFTITSANSLNLGGSVDTRSGGINITATNITLKGNLSTDSLATTGPVILTGAVTLGADVTIDTDKTTDNDITINGTLNSSGGAKDLTLAAGSGDIALTGAIGAIAALSKLAISGNDISLSNIGSIGSAGVTGDTSITAANNGADTGSITFTGTVHNANKQTYDAGAAANPINVNAGAATTFTSSNDDITFKGAVVLASSTPLAVNAGTDTIEFNNSLSAGSNTVILTADKIEFSGGDNSVNGADNITLRPSTANTSIGIAGGSGTLSLSTNDIKALADGFSSITIGWSDGTGDIKIKEVTFKDPVTIQSPSGGSILVEGKITGSGDASITLIGSGATTTLKDDIVTAGQPITIRDNVVLETSNITLSTGAGAGSITVTGTIDADKLVNTRNLTLLAGTGNIDLQNAVGAAALDNLTITSANDVNLPAITLSGNLVQSAGSGTTTFNGLADVAGANITTGAISFNGPGSINAGGGTVNLTAQTGSITSGAATADITAAGIVLSAGQGIGTGLNPIGIDLGAGNLSVTTSGAGSAGDVYIDETNGDLNTSQITTLSTAGASTQAVQTRNTSGVINVNSGTLNAGNDNLTLTTTNVAGRNINFTGGALTTTGNITLNSTGAISDDNAANDITAATLNLSAVSGIGTSSNLLDTTVATLNATTTGAGAGIYINETDNLIVDTVTAGPAGNRGDVVITAGGWIRDIGATVTANNLTLDAVGDIGESDNYFNTAVDTLSATTTGAGTNIYINETDAINIIILSATGGVNLIAGGSILALGAGPHLIASANSLLQAGGIIANLVQPLDVLLSAGNLSVDIGNAIGGVSGALTGITPSGTLVLNNAPPGIVYFNTIQIYSPLTTGASPGLISQGSYLLFWRMILPMLENLALYNNPFTPGGPVFFYHPLTEADWSAFDEFILEEGAYEFIDGALNIIGHEGLLPLLEYIKKKQ